MMNRTNSFCCFSILLFALYAVAAEKQGTPSENVRVQQALRLAEEWTSAALAYQRIPGGTAGVVYDQELIWSHGFGYANPDRKNPATPDTIYGICSISKLFTSVAVLQQRDAGKFRLDDPVAEYLPYVKLEPASTDSPPVTIRSLLTHSSGLPRESAHPYWTDPDFPFPTKEEIITGLSSQKMLYPPDRYYQYSNLGLTFAGELIEQVTKKPYEEYVQESILKPLGLSHTTPFLPETEKGRLLATGYGALSREGIREPMPFYQARGIAPAAGYASNVKDLAAFASWQFRLLAGGGTEVLQATTLREMQQVQWVDPDWKTTWGLGFRIEHLDDRTIVGHSGACPGYFTSLETVPQKKIAAIVMTNAMNVSPRRIAQTILSIVIPSLEESVDIKEPVGDLERFAGRYWSAWGETIVVPWNDGLGALDVPTNDPVEDLTKLKHIAGNTFRRIRTDSDDLGEEIVFEMDADGNVTRMLWHQNYSRKIQ